MPDDPTILSARLVRARRRLADAPPYSPDWDAAMALIEDLERRLGELSEQVAAADEAGLAAPVLR
jgi:hypothetical protein